MATLSRRRAARARHLTAIGLSIAVLLPVPNALAQTAEDDAAGDAEEAPADDAAPPADSAADEAAAAEAEMEAELEQWDEEFMRAPAKGKGAIWGVVRDTKFNEGVIDAQVQIVGRKEKTFADVDGRYRIELPPGKYSIRVSFELHQPSRVDQIEVKAGKVSRIDFKLVPDETSVEEVVIEDEVDHTSNEGQTLERKRSAVVGDGVGRAEIARTPDRNAAEAAQRVVGATIVGGRFVYVRGLGERYTNALLNGAPLPSPEPDRNTVPLDLFPSLVLDSLTITKQFTPDMPGDFAGGSVRINTRDFPRQTLFQVSLSGAYNTLSTFRERPSSYGSVNDWLGWDGGRREFPNLPNRRLNGSGLNEEERVDYGYRINTPMGTLRKVSPPNFGLSVVAGDAYKLGETTKLGGMLALTYGQSFQLRDIIARKYFIGSLPDGSDTLLVGDDFRAKQGIATVRWGLFGSLALELDKRHKLKLLGLRSQSADDLTSEAEGTYENSPGQVYHVNHLEYVSRALNFLQIGGEHRLPKLNDLEINWHASISTADRDQPDTRDVRYQRGSRDGQAGWLYTEDQSGEHSWLAQSDTTYTGGLDLTQPIIKDAGHETRLKFGTLIVSRDREFHARRFRLSPPERGQGPIYNALTFCPGQGWDPGCPGFLFRQDAVRQDGLGLEEWTLNFDQYETGLDVYSLYGMIDAEVLKDFRAVAGVRAEITYQTFAAWDPFDRPGSEQRSKLYQTDYLPAASLIYALSSKTNARFGASRTVARPQLREISPVLFTSYSGDYSVQGNTKLEITNITNLDLRFEFFPTLKEVLAASVFYKRFSKPIEEIIGGTGQLGFTNADSANLAGFELEGRKTLDVLTPALADFTAIANLTLVYSRVDLGDKKATATNANRPLSYQSPYVINLALDYANDKTDTGLRLLYNVSGPRITVVGANGLPDIYELPRHQIDASASQKFAKRFELKLQAQNILSSPVVFAYRQEPGYRKETQVDGGVIYRSLGRQPVTRRYDPGATFTLSATYTY